MRTFAGSCMIYRITTSVWFVLMVLLSSLFPSSLRAQATDSVLIHHSAVHAELLEVQDSLYFFDVPQENSVKQKKEHPRLVAALLCVTLGPFGAHRLYLGTKPGVPVAYTLTLGGGMGVLPVIDFMLICFSKDLSPYRNNPHVFMWNTKE